MDTPYLLSIIAIIVSIIAGIIGIFGGVPGIKSTFFNKPAIEIYGLMPVVVYDEGYDRDKQYPKFSLKGVLKISNPRSYDLSINEMKLYGLTQDSSGKYKYKGKPLFYKLNIPGTLETREDIVKAYGSSYLKFNFAHFENTEEPGVMRSPMAGGVSDELGSLLFHIYVPSFNQLFKFNEKRVPYELVAEVEKDKLNFAVILNNELIKIKPQLITQLVSFSKEEWANDEKVISIFNATKSLKNGVK